MINYNLRARFLPAAFNPTDLTKANTAFNYTVKYKWIMRINLTILIMIGFLIQVSASGFAQKITLNEKNVSFETILNKIQAQSGYDFIGNTLLIKNAKPVSINASNITLKEALDLCFANQTLTYALQDKIVVIKERLPSIMDKVVDFFTAVEINGKVLDEKGNPLKGASIKIKNTKRQTATDNNGHFSLNSVNENAIIQVYYIGYKTKEISVNQLKNNPTIQLEVNTGELDEVAVVISTGYQKIKPELMTGSTSTIDKKAYE